MKTDLAGLRKGDVIVAKVFEKLSAYEYIVSIEGQLIQVQNQTLKQLKVGSTVNLMVAAVKPLQLRLVTPGDRGNKRNIDLSV